jgi:hypothetical protein
MLVPGKYCRSKWKVDLTTVVLYVRKLPKSIIVAKACDGLCVFLGVFTQLIFAEMRL